jgi:uncharacterized CHY-type Zn-finger protein
MDHKQFLTRCRCGATTSKAYARAHGGLCKACATGEPSEPKDISKHPLLCPTCRERLRTSYQKAHGYHCDACTKEADPAGHYFETTGHFPMM